MSTLVSNGKEKENDPTLIFLFCVYSMLYYVRVQTLLSVYVCEHAGCAYGGHVCAYVRVQTLLSV